MPGPKRVRTSRPSAALPLTETDIPGVFRNHKTGLLCDYRGIVLNKTQVRAAHDEHFIEAVGAVPDTPAALLKAVAMDYLRPMNTRLKCAVDAAPYFDMKMPVRTENLNKNEGIAFDMAKLAAMKKADRELLLKLLKQIGVEL